MGEENMTGDGRANVSFFQRVLRSLILSTALKAVTFTLTTLLTRRITPAVRGTVFFVDLYADTVSFLSREALRSTALRSCTIDPPETTSSPSRAKRLLAECSTMFNIAAWAVPLSVALVVLFESLYLLLGRWSPLPSVASYCHAELSGEEEAASSLPLVLLFVLGLTVQSIVEGKVCLAQACGAYSVKVKAESAAVGCRLVFLLWASYAFADSLEAHPLQWCLAAFVMYSLAFFVSVEWAWWRAVTHATTCTDESSFSPWERAIATLRSSHGDRAVKATSAWAVVQSGAMVKQWLVHGDMWWQLFSETVLRLVLTEGEKFALAALGSLSVQGSYDTVMNLGSLVARLVFRLWEESCFAKWSTIMAANGSSDDRSVGGNEKPVAQAPRGTTTTTAEQRKERAHCLAEATSLLHAMLRLALQLSLPFAIFGPPLSRFALHLLYAGKWSSDEPCALLLRLCYALPVMAVNGLLEAFIRATFRRRNLVRAKYALLFMSAVYVSLCFAVMHTGRGVVGVMECLLCTCAVRCVVSWVLVGRERRELLASLVRPAAADSDVHKDNRRSKSAALASLESLDQCANSLDTAKGAIVSLPFLAVSFAIAVAMRQCISDRADPAERQDARYLLSLSELTVTVALVVAYVTCAVALDVHDGLLRRGFAASWRHLPARFLRRKLKNT